MPNFTERLHDRWADVHPFLKFIIVMTLAAATILLAWKPASRVYVEWRAKDYLEEASHALANGDFAEARNMAYKAMTDDKKAALALPILLRAQERMADPQSTRVAAAVLSNQAGGDADRLLAWQVICRDGATWLAASAWNGMTKSESADPRFLEPWIDRMMNSGENLAGEAEKLLSDLPPPLSAKLERHYLDTLALKKESAAYGMLQTRLAERLESHPEDGPILLGALDTLPEAEILSWLPSALEKWRSAFGREPDVLDQLRLIRIRMIAAPETSGEIFGRSYKEFSRKDPLATAKWCLWLRHEKDAEPLLSKLAVSGDPEAYELLAGIYYRAGRHEDWNRLLASSPTGSSALPDCDRAYLAENKGEVREQTNAERLVMESIARNPSAKEAMKIARHAAGLGLASLSRRIWVEAIRQGTGPLPLSSSLAGLFADLMERKEEGPLYTVLTTYRALEPGNSSIACKQLYLGCLMGKATPEDLIGELTAMAKSNPLNSAEVACVTALAHLLLGETAQAIALTNEKEVDWFAMEPRFRAIRAIALKRSRKKDLGEVYLENFPWDSLLPSENRVLTALAAAPV